VEPFRVVLGLALATGCSSNSGDDGSSGDGGEPLPPCEDSEQEPWDCDLPSPCADAVLVDGNSEDEAFEDRAAAVCVAEVLRDRRPSQLRLEFRAFAGDPNFATTIFVVDDIHAISNESVVAGFTGYVATNRQLLQLPEYFDGCLASPTDGDLYRCLAEWSMGCGEDPVGCP